MMHPLRFLPLRAVRRLFSSSSLNVEALDRWISSQKHLVISDTLASERLSDLYITLPTRDGSCAPQPPITAELGYGHHLIFFHPRNPEASLRPDGTDADFCPPEPYTRRMWAGGAFEWNERNPLFVGDRAVSTSTVTSVVKKGFETGSPMIFVNQQIDIRKQGATDVSIKEERSHVYLAPRVSKRVTREVKGLPKAADFSFNFIPSSTTLFRFSALTFNGHHIHLDKDFAQKTEGYPERLVHGPLTALMLLETAVSHNPGARLRSFEYRAWNPLIVDRQIIINGSWEGKDSIQIWATDKDGIIGMTGRLCII